VIRKIGRGKYSEVFEGINVRTNKMCVIKVRSQLNYLLIASGRLSLLFLPYQFLWLILFVLLVCVCACVLASFRF